MGAGRKTFRVIFGFSFIMEDLNLLAVTDNTELKQFEMTVDGYLSLIQYRGGPGKILLIHTEVPKAIRSQGVAPVLVKKTLALLKERGDKVLPYCPFVKSYILRHPEWKEIVHPSFSLEA